MHLSVPTFPKLALALSITGLLTGLAISFGVTPTYISEAEMTLGDSLVTSAPADVRPNLREYFMQTENEVLSRTSLSKIIQDPRLDLYREERARMPLEDVIETMRRRDIRIAVEAQAPGSNYLPFQLTFAYSDRVKAQQTVQALVARFSESNIVRQQGPARMKRAVASDQIYRLEARIAALEKRLGMPSAGHEPDYSLNPSAGIQLEVLDPPSLPVLAAKPNRSIFMASGFSAGFVAALVIAVFWRRPPPIPFPAQTA
jgi:hypothetical protein